MFGGEIGRGDLRHSDACAPGPFGHLPTSLSQEATSVAFSAHLGRRTALARAARLGAIAGGGYARGESSRIQQHSLGLPLHTQADAARALMQLQPVGYERP